MIKEKKIIVCPDSFKGTMTSFEAAEIIAESIKEVIPSTEITMIPIADGGEGTLECYRRAVSGRMVSVQTRNSNFKPINGEYFLTADCAVIESAKVIGLYQTEDKNPGKTTTYGVGQLISDALNHTENIVLTLGGSSTNDGGCGIAAALGVKFYDAEGKSFIPTGETLCNIEKINVSDAKKFKLTCMCDVENPLFGPDGAAYVFAPQKGASPAMVRELDDGLRHLADIICKCVNCDISNVVGGGAAGGIAAGMVAFFNAVLKSGIETMLDAVNFDDLLEDATLIVTGEGKLDNQTLKGKAINGIIAHASQKNIPVIAICGQIEMGFDLKASGLALAIATGRTGESINTEFNYKSMLKQTTINLFKKISGN